MGLTLRDRYDLGDDADPEPRRTRNYRVTVRRVQETEIEVDAWSAADARREAVTPEALDYAEWDTIETEVERVR